MSDAKRFAAIFDGLKLAYGTYKIDRTKTNGKQAGKASVVREPRTLSMWEGHLSGEGDSLGIIPINEDNCAKWGCIDVDEYPLDHHDIVSRIRRMGLPLVVCRSKSGGAHLFLFVTEFIPAQKMQEVLKEIAAALGYGQCEIFPKQCSLNLSRGDVGNFLNLPLFDCEEGMRYPIKDDGGSATLEEFFKLHEKYAQTPEQVDSITINDDPDDPIKDGPPCLQTLCKEKISEGGRNNGLFNIGCYLRKAYPDSWESQILVYNAKYLSPPLPLTEVNLVAKQLQKKDYTYKCKDAPINSYCNSSLCKLRKHGISVGLAGADIANLRKYNSSPPVWFLDVNGTPLELDTEALMLQGAFQRACVEQLNFMPRTLEKKLWEERINQLLQDMSETDGSIVEVSEDASVSGQFYEFLEEFCTAMQKAENREEILLRRPWPDEDKGLIYFRLKDFAAYLRKNKFFEYKSHKIAQRLRDINGESCSLKIKGKATRVWSIPAYESHVGEIPTPSFGVINEVPF